MSQQISCDKDVYQLDSLQIGKSKYIDLRRVTFKQAHGIDFVRDGFPINRFIHDAKVFFEKFDDDQLRSLPSDQRFNLTNFHTSDIDIIASSPLHAYLRTLVGFLLWPQSSIIRKLAQDN